MHSDFTTRKQAERGADGPDGIEKLRETLIATDALRRRAKNDAAPVTAPDLVSTVYAEKHGYDGVWCNDRLDVQNYSAPRGVIAASKIESWTIG